MNLIKWAIVAIIAGGIGRACAEASSRIEASVASRMQPHGDLCSPSYAAERYDAEHEAGVDVRCEDEQP